MVKGSKSSLLFLLIVSFGSYFPSFSAVNSKSICEKKPDPDTYSVYTLKPLDQEPTDSRCGDMAFAGPSEKAEIRNSFPPIKTLHKEILSENHSATEISDKEKSDRMLELAKSSRFRFILIGAMLMIAFISYQIIARVISI